MEMKLLLILLLNSFFIQILYGDLPYKIGIQIDFINTTFQSTNFSISSYTKPVINTFADLLAANPSNNYDFIIYTYDLNLVALTNQYNIPYLVIPEFVNNIAFPPNVFFIESVNQLLADATRALLVQLSLTTFVFIDYQPNPQSQNLVAFNNFTQTLIMFSNTTNVSSIFVTQLPYNAYNVFICAVPLAQTDLITTLLNEAALKGQLNPGKIWIFIAGGFNEADYTIFRNYSNVGATIYSFGTKFNNNLASYTVPIVQQMVVNDYLGLINNSFSQIVYKPANFTAQLLTATLTNGSLAPVASFNPTNGQYNGIVIFVKKVNIQPTSLNLYTYITSLNQINPIYDLSNPAVTVRIGILLSKAYFMQKPSGKYYGYSTAFLSELINLTNFKYVFVFPNSALIGTPYQQLNSLLLTNQADIVLIPMIINYVSNQTYLSDPVLSMSINMLTRGPDVILASVTLAPFSYNIWFGILLIIFLMTFGFWAVSSMSPQESHKAGKKNKIENKYSFAFCLLVIYSSFVMAKLKVKLIRLSSQIFAFILWFATLTIVITYASNMMPFLMRSNTLYPFSTAASLINYTVNNTGVYKFIFVNNSDDIALINQDPVLSSLYNTSISTNASNAFVNDLTSESILLNSGYILIQNSIKNNYIYNTLNCSSDMLTGTNQQYQMVFPMNNNFNQKAQMKALIANLVTSGVAGSLSIIYFGQGPCARSGVSNLPTPVPMQINRLFVLFLFPLMGVVFGVGFVILSILCTKCFRCLKNLKQEKFQIGQKYDANVSSIDSQGVWAFINNRDRPYYIHSSSLHPDLRKQYSPHELEISTGDILHLKYFGKDPLHGYKRFCKDFTDA